MKKLLALAAFALLALFVLLAGGCASQSGGGGYGWAGGAGFPEGRYYDCIDGYDCVCNRNAPDSTFASGLLARQTVAAAGLHRPSPRVIERPAVGDPAPRAVRDRVFGSFPRSGDFGGGSPGAPSPAGVVTGSSGFSGGPVSAPSVPAGPSGASSPAAAGPKEH